MARRRGFWAEMQHERSVRQRRIEQANRAAVTAGLRAQREHERLRRMQEREAATSERERKRLYVEERKAEAAAMNALLHDRVAELDGVLANGIAARSEVTFAAFKRTVRKDPFDPQGLDQPLPEPIWAPPPAPGLVGRAFGGAARHQRATAHALQSYEQQVAEHAAAQAERERQLSELWAAQQRKLATEAGAVEQYNAQIDEFQRAVTAGESEQVAQFFTLVLDGSLYPEDFPHLSRVIFDTEPHHLVIDFELPPQDVIPVEREHRYVQTRDEIDALPRPAKEIRSRYAQLIAQVTLRTLHEVFTADSPGILQVVTFNGRVSAIDKATGQPIRPHLITVSATREAFSNLVLADLDPVACLRHLNALVSPHPYDLEEVKPFVDFDAMLARFKFVDGMDAISTLDSRPDLIELTPTEFEHFIRKLFEEMGMKSWVTQASRDDGVDAVAVNEEPVFGGLCIIQAKRYRGPVGVESVRALAGVMEDKRATKGILVTTSWVTQDGHDFKRRHGRIEIMEGGNLKSLCREHLKLDVLISLPKPPPRRRRL